MRSRLFVLLLAIGVVVVAHVMGVGQYLGSVANSPFDEILVM
jgi:hypothetical protein